MKRKTKIVQISGLRGILTVIFIAVCLAAGFIAFPSLVAMSLWNYVAGFVAIPTINAVQGAMLWAIVVITGLILNDRKKFLVAFRTTDQLSESEMKMVLERIKLQSQVNKVNSMISQELEQAKNETEEKRDKENV